MNSAPVLERLALDAVAAVESADSAAITIGTERRPAVATDETARLLDAYQRSTSDGPSLDAYRTGNVSRLCCTTGGRWTQLKAACEWHQIRSVAAFPIVNSDGLVAAVLTLYSTDHHAFGANEIRAGLRLILGSDDVLADLPDPHTASVE